MAMKTAKTYSIAELAEEFGITTRAIRYYEELGLLKPERTEAGQRIFSSKERGRLKLIFRGKRYGFQLDEIREMIQLFDLDRTGRKQLERTIEYGKGKIEEVTERIEELLRIRSEMEQLLEEFQTKLNELEREKNEYP
ncbi:MerR family DNA-binding transcriptional regulator [Oceanobacillus sp. SE10311]|uniref:MerR family transcriptional regulator n=2 Tax=Oceanobacillus TaxID=182709 RepID=UPI00300DD947